MDSQGAKSVMSNDMKELTEGKEQISSQIRGHKANLSNPSESLAFFRHTARTASPSNRKNRRH